MMVALPLNLQKRMGLTDQLCAWQFSHPISPFLIGRRAAIMRPHFIMRWISICAISEARTHSYGSANRNISIQTP